MPELQTIPARHGVATFVPAGQVIKIINTSGTQVVDTWAFALPKPDSKKGEEPKIDEKDEENSKSATEEKPKSKAAPSKKGKKDGIDLPSQEDAEQATREGIAQGEQQAGQGKGGQQQKSSWSSYVPSIGWKKGGDQSQQQTQSKDKQTQQQKDSKTWSSYFPSGKAFGNYIPKTASDTVSSFTNTVGLKLVKRSVMVYELQADFHDSTNAIRTNRTWSSCRTSPKRPWALRVCLS